MIPGASFIERYLQVTLLFKQKPFSWHLTSVAIIKWHGNSLSLLEESTEQGKAETTNKSASATVSEAVMTEPFTQHVVQTRMSVEGILNITPVRAEEKDGKPESLPPMAS